MSIDKIQGKFVQQQLHNEQVRKNIETLQTLAQKKPYTQVIQELHQWSKSPPHLTVTNTLFWTLISASALIFILLLFLQWNAWFYVIVVGLIGFAWYKKENNNKRDELINVLKYKTLSEKHAITYNANHLSYDLSDLMHQFPSFDFGNYSNEIRDTATGFFQVNQQNFPFTLYNYHYVQEVETRDKDNNVTTHYHHYDRWGIFIGNINVNGISISAYKIKKPRFKTVWTTSDITFNKKYSLSGISELELAKFFNPSRVLALENVMDNFAGDLYFHPDLPLLSWQFSTDIFSSTPESLNSNSTFELAQKLEELKLNNFELLIKDVCLLLEKIS